MDQYLWGAIIGLWAHYLLVGCWVRVMAIIYCAIRRGPHNMAILFSEQKLLVLNSMVYVAVGCKLKTITE